MGYDAGVKEYRDTYWTPDYVPLDTDLLACFKCTGQEGVPREEVAAAVAAESSTGTWSTVWSELLTDLDFYKGRCYRIEDVPGDKESFYAFIAYPLDLFEEGSITNVLTSLVGNVFGFKALRHLRLEDIRFPMAFIKSCYGPPNGIQVERDRMNKYGRPLLGCTIKPKLGLSVRTTAVLSMNACVAVWTSPRTTRTSTPSPSSVGRTASNSLRKPSSCPSRRPASARVTTST